MPSEETRNSKHGIADKSVQSPPPTVGVGARRTDTPPPPQGGGYLDVCTKNAACASADPRMDELRKMRLNHIWLAVADVVGYDLFIDMWQLLDGFAPEVEHCGRARITIPSFTHYARYQRNSLILSLHVDGKKPKDIRRVLIKELREDLQELHISRIIAKANIE